MQARLAAVAGEPLRESAHRTLIRAHLAEGNPGEAVRQYPNEEQHEEYAYQLWNFSSGQDSRQGRWASGPAPDGRAAFGCVEEARPMATEPMLPAGDPRLYNTGSPPGPKAKKAVENVVKKVTPG